MQGSIQGPLFPKVLQPPMSPMLGPGEGFSPRSPLLPGQVEVQKTPTRFSTPSKDQ